MSCMLKQLKTCIQTQGNGYLKSSIKPPGAYFISSLKRYRGGLISNHIFSDEIHNNFPYFTIIPITKTEKENVFFITILLMQRHLYPNSTSLLEIKTKCQKKVTEMKRNIPETSFSLA